MCRQPSAGARRLDLRTLSPASPRSEGPSHRLRRSARLLAALGMLAALVLPACSSSPDDQLSEIRALQDQGAFEESVAPLREVLADDPDNPEANFLLGTALTQMGELGNAVFSLTRASEDPEYAAQAGLMLATNLLQSNNFEKAEEAARRVTENEPDLFAGWIVLAATHLKTRAFEEMLQAVDHALELEPAHLQARSLRASALFELKRYDEAIALLAELEDETREAGDLVSASTACVQQAEAELRKVQKQDESETAVLSRAMEGAEDPRARLLRNEEGAPLTSTIPSTVAEAGFKDCRERYPSFEAPVESLSGYYDAIGDGEAARAAWTEAIEQSPEVMPFRLSYAEYLYDAGDADAAKEVLRVACDDFQTPQAYEALAEMYRLDGEWEEAAAALTAAGELGGSSDRLRFQRAELLASSGHLEEAEALLESVEEDTYRQLVKARIHVGREEWAEALAAYEKALLRWPDNAGARALAGGAAYKLGDFERALAEYRESVRSDPEGSDAGVAAAQIAYALGRYGEAITYVNMHINGRPYTGPEAYLLGARACQALGQAERADEYLTGLAQQPGGAGHALAEKGRLVGQRAGADAAVKLLSAVEVDWSNPDNLPVVRELAQAHIDRGTGAEALPVVDAAIAGMGESADLLDVRGRALLAAERDAEARAAFERALELDPEAGRPHEGLGVLAYRAQDLQGAIEELDRAVALDPELEDAAYRAAQIVLAGGDVEGAIARLRQVVATHPGAPKARNDLAFLLAQRGEDLDEALELAQHAYRSEHGPSVADTLAFVQLKRGEIDDAIETLEGALARTPEVPTLRYRLGEALAAKGEIQKAQSAIKEALGIGPFPEAEQARAMLVKLESGAGSATN